VVIVFLDSIQVEHEGRIIYDGMDGVGYVKDDA